MTGFGALAFIGATALIMFIRTRLLKAYKNLDFLRGVHIAVATLAGAFIVIHAAIFLTYPLNLGIVLGYGSVALALVVWFTGTAFLERVRDSLFFHGPLSLGLGALIIVHASTEAASLPLVWDEAALAVTVAISISNAVYHLQKVRTRGR